MKDTFLVLDLTEFNYMCQQSSSLYSYISSKDKNRDYSSFIIRFYYIAFPKQVHSSFQLYRSYNEQQVNITSNPSQLLTYYRPSNIAVTNYIVRSTYIQCVVNTSFNVLNNFNDAYQNRRCGKFQLSTNAYIRHTSTLGD